MSSPATRYCHLTSRRLPRLNSYPHFKNLTEATGPAGLVGAPSKGEEGGFQSAMGLAMSTRRELTEDLARRYRQASKKEKGRILDQFVQTTGYQRKYAIQLLNWWGRSRLVWIDGKPVKLVVGRRRRSKRHARPRRRRTRHARRRRRSSKRCAERLCHQLLAMLDDGADQLGHHPRCLQLPVTITQQPPQLLVRRTQLRHQLRRHLARL